MYHEIDDYMAALKHGRCRVIALTKKGETREYIGTLPIDACQRIEGSDIVPIMLEDGTYKSFDIGRVVSFDPFYRG